VDADAFRCGCGLDSVSAFASNPVHHVGWEKESAGGGGDESRRNKKAEPKEVSGSKAHTHTHTHKHTQTCDEGVPWGG
jgi:hypothetical protein